MFQQMVHNVEKLTVEIKHFPATLDRSFTFWTVNVRTRKGLDIVTETSYALDHEPTTLIALHGLNNESTIFEAPQPAKCFDCNKPLDKNFYQQERGDSDEPSKPRKICAECAGDGTPTWCDTNTCERPTCHRCFPKEGCYDHEKCQEAYKYANRLA